MAASIHSESVRAALDSAHNPSSRMVRVDDIDTPVPSPFPSPGDWRDRWIYFALVDRFSNPDSPPTALPWNSPCSRFQGGTLEGLRTRLGYLQRLGVGAIWISPVLQNCQGQDGTYHGYGIQHFLKVDPRFASDKADPDGELRRFVDEAHARGMHVIMDIVLNHAGDVFAYVGDDGVERSTMPWRDASYAIRWRGADNSPVAAWSDAPGEAGLSEKAAVWPSELRANAAFRRKGKGGEGGGDFESLKEFVSDRHDVRAALIRCYQHAVAKWDIDGFRIDTLKYVEPNFALTFGNAMREFALEIGKRNFFTFGEVYDGEEKIAGFVGRRTNDDGDMMGVDAALDFPLFFRLPWVVKGFAPPTDIAAVYELRKKIEAGIISSHGEASRYFVTFLDNHDQTARFLPADPANPDRYHDQLVAGLACLFALQGIPCLYYGTEQGLCGAGSSDQAVREALWGKPGAFDEDAALYRKVRELALVHAANPALRYGRQYFRPVSGDRVTFGLSAWAPGILAVSRILNETEVVLVLNADVSSAADISILVDATLNEAGSIYETAFSNVGHAGTHAVEETLATVVGSGLPAGPVRSLRMSLTPGEARIVRPVR
ncbi:alpha-amylase family glycosyl hydrolase [Methylobacterium sp. R2-1]|uniref:alpha-amylase family glycosyl hydrolase n=1 Tax=Methylobacterium sp. R2-1 TaxID=2587064 RepID=UPI0016101A5B|nr:alpha-amylase family glycosyl hydrolase [Methylobacterium sp. R2-1]MBB2961874.1 glycosidase [Methylobacterium sp. R2-1]